MKATKPLAVYAAHNQERTKSARLETAVVESAEAKTLRGKLASHFYSRFLGSRHTTMHEEVQSLRKAPDERAGKAKQKLHDINSPKERISRMALNAKLEEAHHIDERDAQLAAMIAADKYMKYEDDTSPSLLQVY